MFGREPALIIGIIESAIALALAFGLDLSAEQVGAIMAAVVALLSFVARSQVSPTSKGGGGKATLASLVVLLAVGCTPAQQAVAAKAMSTVDAVGRGLSQALGWCEKAGADHTTLERAQEAYRERDYREAVALALEMTEALRDAGHPPPEDVETMLRLAEAALAAQALQDGLRALHGTEGS